MEKTKGLTTASWILIVLGILMIYLGGFYTPNILFPPIVTGIGFFVIAWVLLLLKK